MKMIRPITVLDAMLTSSVAEADYAAWLASTSYAVGNRVIRTTTHRIYECLIAGANASTPETAPTRWLDVGPTNKWACLDQAVGSKTTATGSITMTIAPGARVDSIALLEVAAAKVTVTMTLGAQTLYTATKLMSGTVDAVTDWYSYWQAEFTSVSSWVLTDLPRTYSGASITITLENVGGTGTVSVGTVVVGQSFEIGDTQYGVQNGITDYSVTSTDAFGVTKITERNYAKRMTVPVSVPRARHDAVVSMLASYRAKPVVWVGLDDSESNIIYGWAKDWSGQIVYPTKTQFNLEIKGLV